MALDKSLGEATWDALQPYAGPGDGWDRFFRSPDFLQTCRDVGFRSEPATLDKFVALVIAKLDVAAGAR